ncbi:hypothetical protein MAPG_04034 [Magnaporthiopsis poae ATCC 64411]|uniref:Uncharacterized protein n=1 Tax=Magnaporthiopsis poae (strain ATCC 64411 / 73-15) TaxID=644358 RepID=A0A0C4DVM6_MAGP6|nr:hypothetical protein MAPG_04034 [Magnaporthiopsis poae ATCC 64411]
MRYSQVAHLVALMALAGTATASHVNKPITNGDPVPKADVPPASGYLPHFVQDKMDRYNAERAKEIAEEKKNKQPQNTKPLPEPKPESPGSGKPRTKRDVQPHEEAAQALEARMYGPHEAIGPFLQRQITKNKNTVAAHDAMVRNKSLKEPTKARHPKGKQPKGHEQQSKGYQHPKGKEHSKNDRRDVVQQQQQHQDEEPHAALEARMLGPHKAVGPYLRRQMKKNKQRVAAHDATVRNNRLNDLEPTKAKPAKETQKSRRDVQQEET